MRRVIPVVLGLAVALVGVGQVPVDAQITGTLRGVVSDAQGGVLPGVTVRAESPNLRRSDVTTVTDEAGRYQLVGLPAGTYVLSYTISGFQPKTLTDVRLSLNETATVNVQLELASVQETVTVTGESPLIEVTRSGFAQEVTTETIENMPLNGRQFLDLVGLAAGTAPRPATSQQGSGVTVFGERSITNSFLVDGLENNDDYTRDFAEFYIQDVIQEFKVELGGYQAEFGRAQGAVANVVTKSGTNRFQGRAFGYVRNDRLDASNVPGQDPPKLERTEYGGLLSGPIKRDRTWFLGAVQRLDETRGTNFDLSRVPDVIRSGWFTPTVGGEDFSLAPDIATTTSFAKVDHQFSQRHQLFVTSNVNLGRQSNLIPRPEQAFGSPPPGSIALPSTASDIENNSYSVTGRYTTFLSDISFVESSFRYLRNRYQENTEKTLGAEQLFPGTFNAQNQATFWLSNASSIGILDRKNERYQWAQSLSLFKDTDAGRHNIKFGYDFNRVLLDRDFLAPQTMIVANTFYQNAFRSLDIGTVEIQRSIVLTEGGITRTQVSNSQASLYAQDSWEIGSGLTLNLGLRYDYAALFSDDKNNFAPRIGVAWDPWKNGKTLIRSSFGLYFDQNILELATSVPELGGLQFTSWQQQLIPRGASTYDNPSIGAFGPLQAGGTRWLGNPKLFSYLLPAGAVRTSGNISITGLGRPYIIYELLGIPVNDPRDPPLLTFETIGQVTGGRHTPESALQVLNGFFPGAAFPQFVWDDAPAAGSILKQRSLVYKFRQAGPGISRITTLEHPTKTPFTRSFNIGFEQQVLGDLSVGVEYFVRRSRDLLASRVINLRPVPVSASCVGNTVDRSPCNNQVQYIGFLDANVLALTLRKRLSNRHQFLANYTYTDAVDNFATLRVPPPGGQTNFLFSNSPELDIGRSLNTPNHVFVLSGLVQGPWGIDVAGILKSSSGAPFNAAGGGLDSDGDEIFDNRLIGTEKGGFSTDAFLSADLRLSKQFRFGPRSLTALVELFNLTNRANPLRVNTALGPAIGQTIEPLPGREVQIGFRVDF